MMRLQMILVLSITGLIALYGADAQQTSVTQDWTAIEKYLPEVNLFRIVGDWVLRGHSSTEFNFNRISIRLSNNQINSTAYLDKEVVGFGALDHSEPDSKAIRSEATWNGRTAQTKIYVLYFCPTIIISLIDRTDGHKAIRAFTTSEERVDEELIRDIIRTKLMSNPEIRSIIKDFVTNLVFLNNDILPTNYRRQEMPLSDCDIVDFDLTRVKDLSEWHLRARSSIPAESNLPNRIKWRLNGDQAIGTFYDSNNQEVSVVSVRPVKGTKYYDANVYRGSNHQQFATAFIYADSKYVVLFEEQESLNNLNTEYVLCVWSLNDPKSDSEYLKKVLDNQILYSHDNKRVIKDLVPKLQWI